MDALKERKPHLIRRTRPRWSPYRHFLIEETVRLKKDQPDLKYWDRVKSIREKWGGLSEEEKQPYVEMFHMKSKEKTEST